MSDIKPCPFCQCDMARLEGTSRRYVRCGNEDCDAMGPSAAYDEEAVRIWDMAPRRGDVPVAVAVKGETLHDRYVMAALTGMCANPFWDDTTFDDVATAARDQADAAMKARRP